MKEKIIYDALLLTSGGEYCKETFSYSLDTWSKGCKRRAVTEIETGRLAHTAIYTWSGCAYIKAVLCIYLFNCVVCLQDDGIHASSGWCRMYEKIHFLHWVGCGVTHLLVHHFLVVFPGIHIADMGAPNEDQAWWSLHRCLSEGLNGTCVVPFSPCPPFVL